MATTSGSNATQATTNSAEIERDEFGLPVRRVHPPSTAQADINQLTSSSNDSSKAADITQKREASQSRRNGSEEPFSQSSASASPVEGSQVSQPLQSTDRAIHEAQQDLPASNNQSRTNESGAAQVSEFSHQHLISSNKDKDGDGDDDGGWQDMPAIASYDMYDDNNCLIARAYQEDDEPDGYAGLGGAGKGYTRVLLDDDAESATSMDENTNYLFKDTGTSMTDDGDDQLRDAASQMQATKDLLTEGQRIAYVGLTRLELSAMLNEVEEVAGTKPARKDVQVAVESMCMWSQKMMIRLYSHMEISPDEQVMVEQLSAHGVMPTDLAPVLMTNAQINNPMAGEDGEKRAEKGGQTSGGGDTGASDCSPRSSTSAPSNNTSFILSPPPPQHDDEDNDSDDRDDRYAVRNPRLPPKSVPDKIEIDLRWTVLCDLFLVLVADSIYDSRSRVLLERVGKSLGVAWVDICKFEKKVTDALEMQQNAVAENWNEEGHMENRRKMALKRRYVMMGLATLGGGLVIGLSAGLLAPVIGAGLAAGFTTIGVTGTSGFLAGAGGAAIITSGAAASGSVIGVRAANRRTGAVRTFEYRPLHNNKKANLIVTVSGWMTGKVDDVRLPFSTVDPVMGDIYSILWEPDMLTSMGDTINILATEALTQGLQQVLGSTILISLMAALQLPVVLSKLAYLIDNPWAVSLDRATAAGLILADSLIDRNLGTRPVTLVGYSLGSRVIFSCLRELARKGAYGLVQNVYLFGSPVVVKSDEYLGARSVVSGRFVNGYNCNDWILGYLFRLTNGGIRRVAGLAVIEGVPGLENMDVTKHVKGHMEYRQAMPKLLRECGWLVESDEFTEIEDADPDRHAERQRELINEIEEARKGLEKEQHKEKGRPFGFLSRGRKKALERAEWEVYEDAAKARGGHTGNKSIIQDNNTTTTKKDSTPNSPVPSDSASVLFDVEAIRAELAKEQAASPDSAMATEAFQVRELRSTLPPMKMASPTLSPASPRQKQRSWGTLPRLTRRGTETSTGHARSTSSSSTHMSVPQGGTDQAVEISMTFDTSFDSSPSQISVPPGTHPSPPLINNHTTDNNLAKFGDSSRATRPTLKTAELTPAPTVPPKLEIVDPWAEDDAEILGGQREISLTFA